MKIHSTNDTYAELQALLNELDVRYTLTHENKRENAELIVENISNKKREKYTYMDYRIPNLPLFTYNHDWVRTHILFEIKKNDWESLEQSKKDMIGKVLNGKYIYWKDYKKKDIDFELPTNIEMPKYPLYIISFDRYDTLITMKNLEQMKVPYNIVVKNQEQYEKYDVALKEKKYQYYTLIAMPDEFGREQQELGNYGGIPQRNYCWEHAKNSGHSSHWVIDDNIDGFFMYNYDSKKLFNSPTFFSIMEKFRDGIIEPIALLSPNYTNDVKSYRAPFKLNTKNYSCILINNEKLDAQNIKWRRKYNEDVRLMLDCLEKGIRCIAMNMFLTNKASTGSVKGGNCEIYEYERPTEIIVKNADFYNEKKAFEKKILDIANDIDFERKYNELWSLAENKKFLEFRGFMNKFIEVYRDYPQYISLKYEHKDKRPHHAINTDKYKYKNAMGLISF